MNRQITLKTFSDRPLESCATSILHLLEVKSGIPFLPRLGKKLVLRRATEVVEQQIFTIQYKIFTIHTGTSLTYLDTNFINQLKRQRIDQKTGRRVIFETFPVYAYLKHLKHLKLYWIRITGAIKNASVLISCCLNS
jgi:hypothetical protein